MSSNLTPDVNDLTIRLTNVGTYDEAWCLGNDLLDALKAALLELARAQQELAYTHDRGDHLVYRHEWEAFDKWQRWADEQRQGEEKYQPTAQEFNDAMEGR